MMPGAPRSLLFVVLAGVAFGLLLFAPRRALADERDLQVAIVVGNNRSPSLERAELRYADDDAAKYAALIGSAYGAGHVELLVRLDADSSRLFPLQTSAAHPPTRAELDAAIARVAARAAEAKARGSSVVFTFVFAGHGDVEDGRGFVELEDGRFFREDLEAMITKIPAKRVHVILDACNSVYMLAARKPGGTRFATPEDVEQSMRARMDHVGTFLSTSADSQVYEWSQIESGVFSHVVRSGLSGAADLNGDGRITYGELRAFARIASGGIPNPRFRPRVYARGPGGRDDEVIFEPRAAPAERRLALTAGPERRVTVLDANEVPLVDVRLEAGFAPKVTLPATAKDDAGFTLVERENKSAERRTAIAQADDHSGLIARAEAAPGPVARSAARPFELLFSAPFGPRAVAQLPPEQASEEVYGVSSEDRERMARLLDAAAGFKHDERIMTGIIFGGLGMIVGGSGAYLLAQQSSAADPNAARTEGEVLLALGGVSAGFGAYKLLSASDMEARRDAFLAALHDRPEAFELAVRNAEAQLMKDADHQRTLREISSTVAIALGGVITAGGVIGVVSPPGAGTTPQEAANARSAFWLLVADGAFTATVGVGALFIHSEPERLWELWTHEPSRQAAPPPVQVEPFVGLGGGGIRGTFR
jgi:hypothetical protein